MKINASPETNVNLPVDYWYPQVHNRPEMKKRSIPEKVVLRPNPEDWAIVLKLRERLGVDNSQILRIALRRLLEAEGLQLKAS